MVKKDYDLTTSKVNRKRKKHVPKVARRPVGDGGGAKYGGEDQEEEVTCSEK